MFDILHSVRITFLYLLFVKIILKSKKKILFDGHFMAVVPTQCRCEVSKCPSQLRFALNILINSSTQRCQKRKLNFLAKRRMALLSLYLPRAAWPRLPILRIAGWNSNTVRAFVAWKPSGLCGPPRLWSCRQTMVHALRGHRPKMPVNTEASAYVTTSWASADWHHATMAARTTLLPCSRDSQIDSHPPVSQRIRCHRRLVYHWISLWRFH